MTDQIEAFQAMNEARQERNTKRRSVAGASFQDAAELATKHDMILLRRSNVHYSLYGPATRNGGNGKPRYKDRWLLDLYPGNQRIFRPTNRKPAAPFIQVAPNWHLIDVVKAVVEGAGQ